MSTDGAESLIREELVRLVVRWSRQIEALAAEVRRLVGLPTESRRSSERQVGPFSKELPKSDPKPPARKPWPEYGPWHFRPAPGGPTTTHDAVLHADCTDGGCEVDLEGVEELWQTDVVLTDVVPARAVRRLFRMHVGRGRGCRWVQDFTFHGLSTSAFRIDRRGNTIWDRMPSHSARSARARGETVVNSSGLFRPLDVSRRTSGVPCHVSAFAGCPSERDRGLDPVAEETVSPMVSQRNLILGSRAWGESSW